MFIVLKKTIFQKLPFRCRSFEYGFCAGAAEPLTIDTLSVLPDPLVLATGAEVSLQVLITLLEEIPAGAGVSIKIKKDGLIDIPIPCLDIDGVSIGSW